MRLDLIDPRIAKRHGTLEHAHAAKTEPQTGSNSFGNGLRFDLRHDLGLCRLGFDDDRRRLFDDDDGANLTANDCAMMDDGWRRIIVANDGARTVTGTIARSRTRTRAITIGNVGLHIGHEFDR